MLTPPSLTSSPVRELSGVALIPWPAFAARAVVGCQRLTSSGEKARPVAPLRIGIEIELSGTPSPLLSNTFSMSDAVVPRALSWMHTRRPVFVIAKNVPW